MHLYLVRHADAVPAGGAITSDADRPLSERGVEEASLAGRVLGVLDPAVRLVLTSPLTRAVETGELIAAGLPSAPERRVTQALAPGFRPEELLEEILPLGIGFHCIVVGHQPDMSQFLARLITGGARTSVAFSPGSIASLVVTPMGDRADAQLRWLLSPQLAGALADHHGIRRRS